MEVKSNTLSRMIIALIISCVFNALLVYLLLRNRFSQKERIEQNILFASDSRGNTGADLFADITKSKELFRQLKKEIHPDRFIDRPNLQKYVEEKMKEAGNAQNSYSGLLNIIEKMQLDGFEFSSNFLKNIAK